MFGSKLRCGGCNKYADRCTCRESTRAPAAPDELNVDVGHVTHWRNRTFPTARPVQPHSGNTDSTPGGNTGREVTRLCHEIRSAKSLAWRDSLFEQLLDLIDPLPVAAREPAPVARELDADAERLKPPTLPRYLLDMIGEYGMARTDNVGQLEVQHRWEILISGIKRYAADFAQASRATAESAPASAAPTCAIPGRQCACRACNPHMVGSMMFICPACGDKRCPHAADHRQACPSNSSPVGAEESK